MTVTIYRSTDAGAPSLSGVQGTLVAILKACLVDGFGANAAAGWTIPFTATNQAVFKQPATANGRYILVSDAVADGNTRFTGYENMSSLTTGTGIFPTPAMTPILYQRSTGGNGSVTLMSWVVVATDKMFYFWSNGSTGMPSTSMYMMAFGDFTSTLPNDAYNTILIGPTGTSIGSLQTIVATGVDGSMQGGHFVARNYTQNGGCIQVSKGSDYARIGGAQVGQTGMPFPNPTDGKIYVAPFSIFESSGATTGTYRGTLPGIWAPCFKATTVLNDGDQLTDIAGLPGKVLEAKQLNSQNSSIGCVLVEVSNTW